MTVWVSDEHTPYLAGWMRAESQRRLAPHVAEVHRRIALGEREAAEAVFWPIFERVFFEIEAECEQLARENGLVLSEDDTRQ